MGCKLSGSALMMGDEVLEVNEGCTGIRSFQTSLMLSLFLGEFLFLGLFSRIVTIILGIVLAGALNVVRTVTLTKIYFDFGPESFDRFHDLVGYIAFVFSAAGLFGVAIVFARIERLFKQI